VELALNFVWAALALLAFLWWLRAGDHRRETRFAGLIALSLLLLILFPVISVTDDVWAWQNPAEADTSLRRSDPLAHPHAPGSEFAIPSSPVTADISLAPVGFRPISQPAVIIQNSVPRPILFTRPPPQA
jgi:hypothetical protein